MADPKKDDALQAQAIDSVEEPKTDVLSEPEAEPEAEAEEPPVDHLAMIRELATQLPNTSPSGAETISQKILAHLDGYSAKDREEVNG